MSTLDILSVIPAQLREDESADLTKFFLGASSGAMQYMCRCGVIKTVTLLDTEFASSTFRTAPLSTAKVRGL